MVSEGTSAAFVKGLFRGQAQTDLVRLANECNERVRDYGRGRMTMGTTLTALLLLEGRYYISHVGDCRVYVMGNGMEQLTVDQTYVAREVALGHMTPEQAFK